MIQLWLQTCFGQNVKTLWMCSCVLCVRVWGGGGGGGKNEDLGWGKDSVKFKLYIKL